MLNINKDTYCEQYRLEETYVTSNIKHKQE